MNQNFRAKLVRFVDLFYRRPLSPIIPLETFRYAVAGGINFALGAVLYWLLFNFVLSKEDTTFLGLITISAPILAFLINFCITFFTGFWLTKNIGFDNRSNIRSRAQLFRYAQIVVLNIAVNYFGLKLLVDFWGLYPTPSYMSIQVTTIAISYFASKYYTFEK